MALEKITTRFAKPTDIPRLVDIVQTCFPTAPEWNAPRFMISGWWRRMIANHQCKIIVCCEPESIANAFIVYVNDEKTWVKAENMGPYHKAVRLAVLLCHPRLFKSWLAKKRRMKHHKNIGGTPLSQADPSPYEILYKNNKTEFFAALMGVDKSHRGKGVGATLLLECEKMAAERGTHAVHIYADPRNTKAHQIYRQMGYCNAGVFKHSIVMVKQLQ